MGVMILLSMEYSWGDVTDILHANALRYQGSDLEMQWGSVKKSFKPFFVEITTLLSSSFFLCAFSAHQGVIYICLHSHSSPQSTLLF